MFRILIPFFTSSLRFLEQLVGATLTQLLGYACPDVKLRVSGLAVTDSVRLRVSGGGNHLLSGPFPVVVCPSIGRPGGTGVRSLGL